MPALSTVVLIPYVASDFPEGSDRNEDDDLRVTWRDMLLAVITVGKAPRDVLRFGRYSMAEVIHRVACFEAYFVIKGARLMHSRAHEDLDPTEKALVSYYLGMATTKLYVERVLGVPWLMHVSRYETDWSVRYGGNPERPDLFGCNADGDWVVAEAKGRLRVSDQLITKMQTQKSAVASINGSAPTYRVGVASRFTAKRLDLRVVDPPPREDAQNVPIDPALWLMDYYRPLVDLVEFGDPRQEPGVTVGVLPGTDLELGIPTAIAELVQESNDRASKRRSGLQPHEAATEPRDAGPRRLADQAGDRNLRSIVERVTSAASARQELEMDGTTHDGLTLVRRD